MSYLNEKSTLLCIVHNTLFLLNRLSVTTWPAGKHIIKHQVSKISWSPNVEGRLVDEGVIQSIGNVLQCFPLKLILSNHESDLCSFLTWNTGEQVKLNQSSHEHWNRFSLFMLPCTPRPSRPVFARTLFVLRSSLLLTEQRLWTPATHPPALGVYRQVSWHSELSTGLIPHRPRLKRFSSHGRPSWLDQASCSQRPGAPFITIVKGNKCD